MQFVIALQTCLNKCMQTHQPFTYIVGWTKANLYYIGVKYAKGCKPEDLGTTYFSSSKKIGALWAYCEPDFKTIYPFDSPEEALWFEELLQKEFNVLKSKQFANLSISGKEFRMTESAKEKLSRIRKGKPLSAEHRAKISEGGKRRPPCSAETRAKLSAALKGKKKSAEHIAKMSANATNISEETRAKMSAKKKGQVPWNKGMPRSEETKAKISATKRAKK